MSITVYVLFFVMGCLGILAQALKKMNELNRRANGNFVFRAYVRIERFSLIASFVGNLSSLLFIYMVPSMKVVPMWLLVLGQFVMGWFGQSALELLMGQAKKQLGQKLGIPEEEIRDL